MLITTVEEYDLAKKNFKKGDIFKTKCTKCGKSIDMKFFARNRLKFQNKTVFCRSCAIQKVWDNRRGVDRLRIEPFTNVKFKIEHNLIFGQNGFPIKEKVLNLKCEKCGKEFARSYKNFKKGFKKSNRILCSSCSHSEAITVYNNSIIGKNPEQRFGVERGHCFRQKMSEATSGKNNPRFGIHLTNDVKQKIKNSLTGISLEERYGKEKADTIKHQMSLEFSGDKNPMFGRPSPKGSGNGWSGWFQNFYFRSLLELGYLIENSGVKSAESIKIPYFDFKGSKRTYHPDFIIDNNVIEIKPLHLINSPANKLKFEAAEKWCLENNLAFSIKTEKDIHKPTYEELKKLKEENKLQFLQRYEEKFIKWGEKYGNRCI